MKHFAFFLAALAALVLPFSALRAADYSVTTSSVLPSSSAKRVTQYKAGTAIAAGDAVYLSASNTWLLADANGTTPSFQVAGIAENSAASGQIVSVVTEDDNFTPGFTVAANAIVILSATPGKLAPAADLATGHYLGIVGVGVGSNKIKLLFKRSDVVTP